MKEARGAPSAPPATPPPHVEWAKEYNDPKRLFFKALMLSGKQLGPLALAFWKICEWNPSHYLITMHCYQETFGMVSYPCEATKAFARCFPILAISICLVVTARMILQSRIYYHFLMKKYLLDFQNYKVSHDPAVVLLVFCFTAGMLHFVLDIVYPPFLAHHLAKIMTVGEFTLPCVVFFVVFNSGCCIEQHLVTVNQFYEDDPAWASSQLNGVRICREEDVRAAAKEFDETRVGKSLDALLDEAISAARDKKIATNEDVTYVAPRINMFQGFWPSKILLAAEAQDESSKKFKQAMQMFRGMFVVVHAFLLVVLMSMTLREINDTVPSRTHRGDHNLGGGYYDSLGTGYCRDDSMQRPFSYYISWANVQDVAVATAESPSPLTAQSPSAVSTGRLDKRRTHKQGIIETDPVRTPSDILHKRIVFLSSWSNSTNMLSRSRMSWLPSSLSTWVPDWLSGKSPFPKEHIEFCASHCTASDYCIGFAVCNDYCSIYNSHRTETPIGWIGSSEGGTRSRSLRRTAQIIQTNQYELAACWSKPYVKGEPQDAAGAIVCFLHVLIVSGITYGFLKVTN